MKPAKRPYHSANRLSLFLSVLVLAGHIFIGCSIKSNLTHPSFVKDGKYDSEFPSTDCSAQLETILKSVRKVNCYVSYRTYVFGEKSHTTLADLSSDHVFSSADASLYTNEATSGTALIIQSDANRIALLTCAHIVNLPDTIISWSEFQDLESNKYIRSISFKVKEQITIRDVPEGAKFTLLACDQKRDLAVLGREYSTPQFNQDLPAFPYPTGHSAELNWGDFLYLAGYPTGQLMVTKGIVSKTNDTENNFLTDAPFNEGFSGGIVMAIRDGIPNFELVGIGRSVTAGTEYYIKPEKEIYEYNYNPSIPYDGPLYVKQKKEINYGVTWVVPIDRIRDFYLDNRLKINSSGYQLDSFFKIKLESKPDIENYH
jgi:hypothetical protein